jgi:hypothetical protein
MLFDNDGSSADVLNAYAELFGDGAVMDSMRGLLLSKAERETELVKRDIQECAERVKATKERRVIEQAADMIPDFTVPTRLYHTYASAFRMRAAEDGIELEGNGYECWYDADFQAWFKRRYPELTYREEKRTATIVKDFGQLPQLVA